MRGGAPKSLSRSVAIAAAVAAGSPALTAVASSPPGSRRADRESGGAAGRVAALRVEGVKGLRGRLGSSSRVGDQERRPIGARHQHRGRDRALPVVFVDQGRPPPDVARRRSRGRRRAPRRPRWRPGRRRRPGSCCWSRRPDSRVARAVPPRPPGARRFAGRRDRRGAARGRSSPAAAAAEDRGDDEDDREEDQRPDQPSALRDRRRRRFACRLRLRGRLRLRLRGFAGSRGFRRSSAAGTSALIGRSAATRKRYTRGNWLVGQLSSRDWLTDQSINAAPQQEGRWISH